VARAPAGHEALQALLAFSSLHEQIRQRRARELRAGHPSTADAWELEQFVLDEVLLLVAERALAVTGADGIAIALAEDDAIVCRASSGVIAPDAGARLDPHSGFSGACLRSGRIVRCDDAETDPRVNVAACRRLGARSLVAVPIAGLHGVMGLLEAFSSEAFGFNDSDVRSLNLLAELILAAMKPEEEDRLAQISQRVVSGAAARSQVQEISEAVDQDEELLMETEGRLAAERVAEDVPFSGLPRPEGAEDSRPGLSLVLVLIMIAALLGAGLWWKIRHQTGARTATPPPNTQTARPPSLQPPTAAQPEVGPTVEERSRSEETDPASAGGEDLSEGTRVTGIQHVSSPSSSVVIVELQNQVQYEAHRLSDPERIYFDLHDTSLAPGLFGKTIEVGDKLLDRVRIAQPRRGVTRIVLETKGSSDFSVSFQSSPSRLIVEVRPATPEQPKPKPQSQPLKSESLAPVSPLVVPPANQNVTTQNVIKDEGRPRLHAPKFRIVLDAGHGGWDLGTVGRKGLLEKDLVMDIVGRLGKLVDKGLGAEIVYTRPDDNYVALEKRAEIANLAHADLFVSVHANYSSDSSARGVETYYTNTYSSVRARTREFDEAGSALENINWTNVDIREKVLESRRFASSVQHAVYGTLASQNPDIRNRGVKRASYVVLTGTTMPAILAEVSFVSNSTDESKLRSSTYRQQIAEALYQGIAHYAATFHSVTVASASTKPAGK
jgi:N-acetylmuramoyl-L-alanine amidase